MGFFKLYYRQQYNILIPLGKSLKSLSTLNYLSKYVSTYRNSCFKRQMLSSMSAADNTFGRHMLQWNHWKLEMSLNDHFVFNWCLSCQSLSLIEVFSKKMLLPCPSSTIFKNFLKQNMYILQCSSLDCCGEILDVFF